MEQDKIGIALIDLVFLTETLEEIDKDIFNKYSVDLSNLLVDLNDKLTPENKEEFLTWKEKRTK